MHILELPKGKRRWLARVVRLALVQDKEVPTLFVAIAVAFCSNRRGEFTEQDAQDWIERHRSELPRLLLELAREPANKAVIDELRHAAEIAAEPGFTEAI